jgi:type I restriction enzyme S subunit
LSTDRSYPLPPGWSIQPLASVCAINPKKPATDALKSSDPVTFVPMPAIDADAGAITAPLTRAFASVRKGFTAFANEDVIVAKITPCFENGKAALCRGMTNGLGFGSTEFHVLRCTDAVIPEYVYHFVRQESFRRDGEANMTGSVGQKRVPADWLKAVEIPLAPLAEQRRIVSKVEALLARVNAARQRLGRVPAVLKRFRQSVLAAACSGRLTADWRRHEGLIDESEEKPALWKERCLSDLCTEFNYGSSAKSSKEGLIPVLRMGNLQDGKLDWTDLAFTSDADEIDKYALHPNTVLFNRTNSPELVGKTALYRGERPAVFAGYLIRVVHGPELDPHFLNFALNAPIFRDYCASVKTDGVSQSNINAQKLAAYPLSWCPLPEQREIVRQVEALFALADKIEARVTASITRADKLIQATLAKAFRGELVPTEAELAELEGREFETAQALLDRIHDERNRVAPSPGRNGLRRSASVAHKAELRIK